MENNRDHNDLLDRSAFEPLSAEEKQIVGDGQRAGGAPSAGEVSAAELGKAIAGSTGSDNGGANSGANSNSGASDNQIGVNHQTVEARNLEAATEPSALGGDADISGGEPNLAANTAAPVEQDDYNR